MSQEFETAILYIEKMKSRYFHALSAFYVYKTLDDLTIPKVAGEEIAEQNSTIIKSYINFFMPSKEALRVYFFLELAKLFDIAEQSLCITKIVNYAQSNAPKLKVKDFAEYNQNREFVGDLSNIYQGMSNDDIKEIQDEVNKNKDVLKRLKDYRDQCLCHDDISKDEINITGDEIIILFSVLKKILGLFSSKLDFLTTLYGNAEKTTKIDTERIIDHLKRFEPYRLKEIDEFCQVSRTSS